LGISLILLSYISIFSLYFTKNKKLCINSK
jgi:hypothetical protein